jgi:hypothetical protein
MMRWPTVPELPQPADAQGRYRWLPGLPRCYRGRVHRPPGMCYHYPARPVARR